MGDSGLGDREVPAELLAGVLLGARDRLQQGEPAWVRQRLGDAVELTRGEQSGWLRHSSIYIELYPNGQGGRSRSPPRPGARISNLGQRSVVLWAQAAEGYSPGHAPAAPVPASIARADGRRHGDAGARRRGPHRDLRRRRRRALPPAAVPGRRTDHHALPGPEPGRGTGP